MEPGEALGVAAQIAVALAGFAGVVVVFRSESVHDWSAVDKFRLRLLLTNSLLPLVFCMLGMLLLTVKPMPAGIWRWCSGFAFLISLLFGVTMTRLFRRFDAGQLEREGATQLVFYFFGSLGIIAMLLQLYNVAFLGGFWPFYATIFVQLVTALFQFARIILLPQQ